MQLELPIQRGLDNHIDIIERPVKKIASGCSCYITQVGVLTRINRSFDPGMTPGISKYDQVADSGSGQMRQREVCWLSAENNEARTIE
ncbi:MAG: hypothetical protein K2X93_21570 [Candidatus Obscuribacterales bacterium]|nr:hypothetical protein [Candidatus Obscuribacterales bacterium]